jgi:hypothetical protein
VTLKGPLRKLGPKNFFVEFICSEEGGEPNLKFNRSKTEIKGEITVWVR